MPSHRRERWRPEGKSSNRRVQSFQNPQTGAITPAKDRFCPGTMLTAPGSIRTIAPLFLVAKNSDGMKTYTATPADIKHDWYLVDASGKTLGRLASEIARRLRGKHKPEYTPHMDTGDYIVVINAEKVSVSGNKAADKLYHSHTGFPGGLKTISFEKLLERKPESIIEKAVKGMLPRGPLGRDMFRKLRVYAGAEHQHGAQQPKPLEI